MTPEPDFYLVKSLDGEWSECVTSINEVYALLDQEPSHLYKVVPSDGSIRDVFEDVAHLWFADKQMGFDPIPKVIEEWAPRAWIVARDGPESDDSEWEQDR